MKETAIHSHCKPIVRGGMTNCPACSKTAVGVMADASYGMRRFAKAALASTHQQPTLISKTPFLADEDVLSRQAERKSSFGSREDVPSTCSNFKVSDICGKSSDCYDILGMAAVTCRYDIVVFYTCSTPCHYSDSLTCV
jgi:hypothetical protein